MAQVILKNLTKVFDNFTAVKNFSARVEDGKFITLLGPSGCGKTTTLRMIAGFIEPTVGEIIIGKEIVYRSKEFFVPPENRNIGMVFQSYAVWPHMNLLDNVSYPLKIRKISKKERYAKAAQVLEMVKLEGMGQRYPHQLSGGEQQRVALARALIVNPYVMLLDEPLSNLDAKLREQMRFEIKELQKKTKVTIIYVTHDQAEAMAMSDEIIVMNKGEIQQIGKPEEIYENPANKFVANFIGLTNFIPCKVSEDRKYLIVKDGKGSKIKYAVSEKHKKEEVILCVRLEDITLKPYDEGEMNGQVIRATYLGNLVDYLLQVGEITMRVQLKDRRFSTGDKVSLIIDKEKILLY
ncbi:MAG TPA: ABC transporter ATP-binding protein [Candidatus Atribacteria bacterium]|nr:MAG: ABC transporter ATP-binding protein [Candidatus Nealsonbacteria bacterium]HDK28027.1 ABC transporter ATP-binding protein [Candidatus Atribacteria bacterium]